MSISDIDTPQWPIASLLAHIRGGNVWLWRAMLALTLGLVFSLALMAVDHRLLLGVNVWDKPAKFFLSLIVQFATVGWAMSLLPRAQNNPQKLTVSVGLMIAAAAFEMAYICFRASRGEASHFNDSSIFAQVMYGLMGLGAVTLTATGFLVGLRVWRARGRDIMMLATGLGLMLGMVLATLAGGYMSQTHGHWVGGEMSDAHGLGFFGWSTTGGDLRVPHFIGMHLAQALPLAAISGSRFVVFVMAAIGVAATLATFAMALMGVPLLHS